MNTTQNTLKATLHKKMKFSIEDFFSKCDQIRRKLRIWYYLLKKSLMENFSFCAILKYAFMLKWHILIILFQWKKKKKKKKRVQTHYSLKKWSFKKKSFILNMDPEEELAATVVVYILEKKKKRKKWKTRSTWVKPWPTRRDALGIALLSLHESGFKSHKHLSFLQMQIKLPVSSCFLFMVAFIPFLYQLYFFILWNRN